MVKHSLTSLESLSSACVKGLEFAEIRFILFVLLCDCKIAAPTPILNITHNLKWLNWMWDQV